MTKELLITLIKKDIEELKSLTGGFEQMADIPAILLELSIKKATELRDNLSLLGDADAVSVREEVVPLAEPKREEPEVGTQPIPVVELTETPVVEPQKSATADEECVETTVVSEPEEEKDAPEDESIEEQIYEESGVNVVGWMEESEELVSEEQADDTVEEEMSEPELAVESAVAPAQSVDIEEETEEEELEAMAESMETEDEEEAVDLPLEQEPDDYVLASDVELKEAASLAHEINGTQEVVPEAAAERPTAKAEPVVTRVSDTINKSESLAQSLSSDDDTSVNGTLQKKPIEDLKGAITIADRFRFQRELFGGDGEKMMKTIADLNEMQNMEQAETYLAKRFDWSQENGAVADFMSLLRRRY